LRREDVRVAVLHMEGSNCEDETVQAFSTLGAAAEKVHLKQLTDPSLPEEYRRGLMDYHVLGVPGGFSAGDYVRAGAIFGARLKAAMGERLKEYVVEGRAVVGICNGFQVLAEMGLLPGLEGILTSEPEAVLATNDSGHYECRPTLLKYENQGRCGLTAVLRRGQILQIPSAHAEGKFLLPMARQEELLKRLVDDDQVVFRYVDDRGEYAGYPWNPNGSVDNIAGVCNPLGNVFAMMPHPERAFHRYLHPDWTRSGATTEGDGRQVFDSILDYVTKRF
jgi:phosphoribosylformylglycinamidine synthase